MNGQGGPAPGLPDGWVPPDDWVLIRAAKYLGVAPWDLAAQPVQWLNAAIAYADAENRAQQAAQEDVRKRR